MHDVCKPLHSSATGNAFGTVVADNLVNTGATLAKICAWLVQMITLVSVNHMLEVADSIMYCLALALIVQYDKSAV